MKIKDCPYCWPTKRKSHILLHIEYYMDNFFLAPLIFLDKKLGKFLISSNYSSSKLSEFLIKILNLLRIIKFENSPSKEKFFNRSLIFFNEAKNRGLDIQAVKLFGKYIELFRLKYNGNIYYFDTHPLDVFNKKIVNFDKSQLRQILGKNNIPIPKGGFYKSFSGVKKDLEKKFNYPLVVKPNTGSLSHHITVGIDNYEQLKNAVKIVQQYRPDFIIEEFLPGELYRATVINDKYVFVCKKDKPNIVGDGVSSIYELILGKNNNTDRGEIQQKSTTLHKIPINENLKENLKMQGLYLDSIPSEGEKIYIHNKYILGEGCDIIDFTSYTHQENIEMFKKTSYLFDEKIVGIDFIAEDISKSYKEQKSGIIETNNLPYIDMHKVPSHGNSYPVEKYVWDEFFRLVDSN